VPFGKKIKTDHTLRASTEIGVNPSHILAKSLTVLNPLKRVDEHIMDDADLAGPLVFCFAFALVLLFVSGSVCFVATSLTCLS
jgi:hypothetical protein